MTCGDTSIAVDPDRVKSLRALESSASGGVSVVEPGDGLGAQLWLESGERLTGAGCDDLGATLHGAVCERAGAWLCHPGSLQGLGLQSKRKLAAVVADPGGAARWSDGECWC